MCNQKSGSTVEKSVAGKRRFGFVADRTAITALEYGVVASILGLVLVGIFSSFGKTLTTLFSHVATSI